MANTANTTTPYQVDAEVFSPTGSPVTAKLYYRLNGGSFIEVGMTNSSGQDFWCSDTRTASWDSC
ncbi:MAG: hypothetical protein IPG53_02855 [Ignavibacteriales bacterium]|nr:hypothetical protein [Ignavibacteriales bacterium]